MFSDMFRLGTFISTGHPLYGPFVIAVLTNGEGKDAHLGGNTLMVKLIKTFNIKNEGMHVVAAFHVRETTSL